MTATEARALAATVPGLVVRIHKRTWEFIATFHTTHKTYKRCCGKDFAKACDALREFRTQHAKRNSNQKLHLIPDTTAPAQQA